MSCGTGTDNGLASSSTAWRLTASGSTAPRGGSGSRRLRIDARVVARRTFRDPPRRSAIFSGRRGGRAPSRLVGVALLFLLVGCGLGPGKPSSSEAELRVTRDFGQERVRATARRNPRDGDTVLRFLQSTGKVETAYGGGFVQSIDGIAGEGSGGRSDWFYFVNGLEGGSGAAERRIAPGDVVQWDFRRWGAAMSIPAIVGAYPEPLLNGIEGKRLPVRVECADDDGRACREVQRRLRGDGVVASVGPFGEPGGEGVLRLVVAPWSLARRVRAASPLERGPEGSGVFARFAQGGRRLELLDSSGRTARVAPPGSGLVAAAALEGQQRVWLVTGADEAGVERAAAAMNRATLSDRFAVAALPSGPEALPLAEDRPR